MAVVKHVTDGDTFDALTDPGMEEWGFKTVRIEGIYAPDKGQPGYEESAAYLASLIPIGSPVLVWTHRKDQYGRWVSDVAFLRDGARIDLGDAMVSAGHARNEAPR